MGLVSYFHKYNCIYYLLAKVFKINIKTEYISSNFSTCKSDSGIRAFTQATNNRPPRGADKIRAASGPSILPRPEDILINDPEVNKIFKIISICKHFDFENERVCH